jgi:hypothetical protein
MRSRRRCSTALTWLTAAVASNGLMKWRNRAVSVSEVSRGEAVGLEELADGEWAVYFGPVRLGTYEEQLRRIRPYGHGLGGRSPAASARADA